MVGELEYVCMGRWASADEGREGGARGGIAEDTRELWWVDESGHG